MERNVLILFFLVINIVFVLGAYLMGIPLGIILIPIVFCLILYETVRWNTLFNYYNIFSIYFILYSFAVYISNVKVDKIVMRYSLYASIFYLLFSYGYFLTTFDVKNFSKKIKILSSLYTVHRYICYFSFVLTSVAYIVFFKVLVQVGFANFFFVSRAERSLITSKLGVFSFYPDFWVLASCMSFLIWMIKRRKIYFLSFFIPFITIIVYAILTISRNYLVLALFPIIFLSSFSKKISNTHIILFLIFGLILASVWKPLLYRLIFYHDIYISFSDIKVPREFLVWYEIAHDIENFIPYYGFLHGKSLFIVLGNILFPFFPGESLTSWYVRNFQPEVAFMGGGRGFSVIIESVMNFDILGILLISFALGTIIGIFSRYATGRFWTLIIYALSLGYIHRIFRADLYSFVKTFWWFYFVPILLFIFIFTFLSSLNRFKRSFYEKNSTYSE